MNNEYIIINKTAIQKRIEELEEAREASNDPRDWSYISGKKAGFEIILSQSTPLIPEIEKAWLDGNTSSTKDYKEDYIENLKLDI